MASSPIFVAVPRIGSAVLSTTAETSYTAPTHTVSVLTAGTNGTLISEVDLIGLGTTLAGVCQLYTFDGTTYHAIDTIIATAIAPSTTQQPLDLKMYPTNLVLPTGWSLVAASFVASQLAEVVAYGWDY